LSAAYAIPPPSAELRASTLLFHQVQQFFDSPEALSKTGAEIERHAVENGREVVRRMIDEHMALRASVERRVVVVDQNGKARPILRRSTGTLLTLVGPVSVPHLAYQAPGLVCRAPLEASLNLPDDSYSHLVRRRVAQEVARDAFDEACRALGAMGCHVPKRQAEQLALRAAQDFDDFYRERTCAPMPSNVSLLVLTFDGKGVVMLERDLRDETRKKAEKKAETTHERPMKRLASGEKKNRKRMAEVAAVYGQRAVPRTAQEVLDGEGAAQPSAPRPKPQGKRVWASVEKEAGGVIEAAFEEADRRDPERKLTWVVLVDGNQAQLDLIHKTARKHGVKVHVLMDVIHVLEYLWKASYCFHEDGTKEAEAWVSQRLRMLLEGSSPSDVAAGMKRSATQQQLARRKAVDKCAACLCKHRAYLDYARALREGWPIATGVIEGACRHLIKDRMEKTGARWTLEMAEAILKLRALRSSGDFEAYWEYHQAAEYKRNHASRYENGNVPNPLPVAPRRPSLRAVK